MKSYKRVASAVLGMAMAASCMAPITACSKPQQQDLQ